MLLLYKRFQKIHSHILVHLYKMYCIFCNAQNVLPEKFRTNKILLHWFIDL